MKFYISHPNFILFFLIKSSTIFSLVSIFNILYISLGSISNEKFDTEVFRWYFLLFFYEIKFHYLPQLQVNFYKKIIGKVHNCHFLYFELDLQACIQKQSLYYYV